MLFLFLILAHSCFAAPFVHTKAFGDPAVLAQVSVSLNAF